MIGIEFLILEVERLSILAINVYRSQRARQRMQGRMKVIALVSGSQAFFLPFSNIEVQCPHMSSVPGAYTRAACSPHGRFSLSIISPRVCV